MSYVPTADSRFYALFPLQEVIHDKTDGSLLSGGIVTFYKDSDRSVLKNVYQQAQAGDVYEYIPVQNPITLTSIGSYGDDNGNDFIPFLFPFEGTPTSSDGSIELYYITVESSGYVDQFSREGWPPGLTSETVVENSNIAATNLLTNPAFSEVLFDASVGETFVTASPGSTLSIAPGWDIVTTGTGAGTVTVSQVPIAGNAANDVGNPPYALQIASTSVSTIKLQQRLEHSPGLIAGGFISGTMTVKSTVGAINQVTMTYTPSVGDSHDLAQGVTTADNNWLLINQAPNGDSAVAIDGLINSQTSTAGYVSIVIALPANTTVQISNLQISAVSSVISSAAYIQQSVAEMTNNLYWYAYPIVAVGSVIDYAGFVVPTHYLLCDGTAYNRATYGQLFRALTTTESVTLTNTVATFTVADSANYHAGMPIEGTNIPASTTILSIAGNVLTMSAAATGTGASTVRFFAWGAGNGTDTFNVPSLSDYVVAGTGGTLFGAANNAVGLKGGSATHTMTELELVPHVHAPGAGTGFVNTGGASGAVSAGSLLTSSANTASTGSGNPFTIVQQTALMKKCIRYQ
jgi:hypothetical protein